MSNAVNLHAPPGGTHDATGRSRGRPTRGRTLARGTGQTLITLGLVALLFTTYQLWITDLFTAARQDELSRAIHQQWRDAPTISPPSGAVPSDAAPDGSATPAPVPVQVNVGEPFAVLHVPRLGADYSRVVVEGTSQTELAQGPGHYVGTAMPGEQGNFALAGHRVGRGSPFLELDRLRPGDPIVVETAGDWFVYRVLGDPATGTYDGDPSGIPGQEIVRPTDVAVISPVPGSPAAGPTNGAYLTLTTCHPKYSARQRLVVHARLDGAPLSRETAPAGPPALTG